MDRRWILGGILFAGGVGVVRAITYRPKLDEESRVMLIGDSFANGMAPHFQTLASESGLPFIGGAINGTTVGQWANSKWLVTKLLEFEPTHVLISLGGNDSYSAADPEEVAENALELIELIKDADAHPIWIGAPALPLHYGGNSPNVETLQKIKEVAPYYYESTDLEIPRSPDKLHPTAAGYAGWAGVIWNWLT